MSILRLGFSLLVIFALWSDWIPRALAYLRRKYTLSGIIATLVDNLERLEQSIDQATSSRLKIQSLPEDIRQRLAKLPELVRSCLALIKDAQNSPQHETLVEALKVLAESMDEIHDVEDAIAQHLGLKSRITHRPNVLPRTDLTECR